MKKFEYRKFESSGPMSLSMMNALGEDGWELVSEHKIDNDLTPWVQIFKKEYLT